MKSTSIMVDPPLGLIFLTLEWIFASISNCLIIILHLS